MGGKKRPKVRITNLPALLRAANLEAVYTFLSESNIRHKNLLGKTYKSQFSRPTTYMRLGVQANRISLSPYQVISSDAEYVTFLEFSRQFCSHIHFQAPLRERHIISINNKEVYCGAEI